MTNIIQARTSTGEGENTKQLKSPPSGHGRVQIFLIFVFPSSFGCRNAPHNTRIEVGVDVRTAPNAQVLVF